MAPFTPIFTRRMPTIPHYAPFAINREIPVATPAG